MTHNMGSFVTAQMSNPEDMSTSVAKSSRDLAPYTDGKIDCAILNHMQNTSTSPMYHRVNGILLGDKLISEKMGIFWSGNLSSEICKLVCNL